MMNLLPPQKIIDMQFAKENVVLRRYIILLVLAAFALTGITLGSRQIFLSQKASEEKAVHADAERIKKLEPIQKDAQTLSATINTISTLFSRDVQFSHMLTNIASIMPPGSSLTGLQVSIEDTKAPLIISADVDTEEKAAVLLNNLEHSKLFKKTEIASITNRSNQASDGSTAVSTAPSPYRFRTAINAFREEDVKK